MVLTSESEAPCSFFFLFLCICLLMFYLEMNVVFGLFFNDGLLLYD